MTETKTITEQNKLIAQFMGLSFDPKKKDGAPFYKETNKDGWESKSYCNPLYHSSWASLMPVVEKIQHLKEYNPDGKDLRLMSDITVNIEFDGHYRKCRCSIIGSITHCYTMEIPHTFKKVDVPSIWVGDKDTAIEATYLAVCDFIKWYTTCIEKQPTTLNQGV